MDLWQLKIFSKVAELNGFSKAAYAVNITQPTVSNHIKDLEEHFGCRLFDRLGKKVVLTRSGELLLRHVKKILSTCENTETAMAEFSGKISGKLYLGGSTIPGNYILPRVIPDFIKKYPGAYIAMNVADTRNIANMIADGSIDLGVIGARVEKNILLQSKLISDEMCLAVPAGHKWAKKKEIDMLQLLAEPFLIREKGSGTLKSVEKSLSSLGYGMGTLNIIAELGSTASIIEGIKAGLGVSILSAVAIKEELATGTLVAVSVSGLNLKRDFYITTHKQRTPSPLCAAFNGYLKKRFAPAGHQD